MSTEENLCCRLFSTDTGQFMFWSQTVQETLEALICKARIRRQAEKNKDVSSLASLSTTLYCKTNISSVQFSLLINVLPSVVFHLDSL